MRKFSIILAVFTFFLAQTSFAAMMANDETMAQCDTIAKACKDAGFTDEDMGDKNFWFGCMKPVLFNKTVNGVTVDAKDVKECRKAKIAKMKKELKELQDVK